MVFLIFLHVIALSKVSTSSTDYTAIILLSVLTHLKSEKAKVEVNESESRAMCQRGFRDNWQTGKPHRFPFLAEVADCASLDLLWTQTAFDLFLLSRNQLKPLLKGRQFSLFERWHTSKLPRYVLASPPHYSLWSAITIHHSQ